MSRPGTYITHNAMQLQTLGLDVQVCDATSSSCVKRWGAETQQQTHFMFELPSSWLKRGADIRANKFKSHWIFLRTHGGFTVFCSGVRTSCFCSQEVVFLTPNQVLFVPQPIQSISTVLWRDRKRKFDQTNIKLHHKETFSLHLSMVLQKRTGITSSVLQIGLLPCCDRHHSVKATWKYVKSSDYIVLVRNAGLNKGSAWLSWCHLFIRPSD